MSQTLTVTQDIPTQEPHLLSHAHPTSHDPVAGCIAPCGFVWRNGPQDDGIAKCPPCSTCMNLHLNGLLTPDHICQGA